MSKPESSPLALSELSIKMELKYSPHERFKKSLNVASTPSKSSTEKHPKEANDFT
jgi:hypothetical protein